jgi:hypothetical protein
MPARISNCGFSLTIAEVARRLRRWRFAPAILFNLGRPKINRLVEMPAQLSVWKDGKARHFCAAILRK